MRISSPPPPLPSYPTPITAIACPSIGNGVKIALKITIGGNKSPKKNERAGIQSRELVAARPLTDDGSMGGGGEFGRRDGSDIVVVVLLLHIKTRILFRIPHLPVDEHAKLKAKLKTKQSSQPRNPSPTCVSRVKWGQVSLIPDESHKGSHTGWSKGSHNDKGCDRRGSAIP
jgi:hypothetical protein